MFTMSYEQAAALGELLNRIDEDEQGSITLTKQGIDGAITVGMEDGTFEISGGGTVERLI